MASNFCFAWDRNPAWKWNRATSVLGGGPEPTVELDSENGAFWINRAVEFQRAFDRDPEPTSNKDLVVLYGDVYTAYDIYTDSSTLFKSELEALILARVEQEELSVESGVSVKAIRAYEELFFDVREKLDYKMYVLHHVLGPEIQNLSKNDTDLIWKLFGYHYGPEMVRALVSRTVNPQVCATSDTVEAALESDVIKSIKLAASVAAKNPDGGDRNQRRLMDTFAKFMEIDKMEDFSQGSDQALMWRHVTAMMNSMNFSVGMRNVENGGLVKGQPQAKYLKSAVDLTQTELIDVAITGEAKEAEADMELKYPKPVRVEKK